MYYLEKHGAEYKQILTADTRDIIFQDDVFKYFENEKNYIGYTTEAKNIEEDSLNRSWIENQYGKEETDKIANRKIICCGTVIGTPDEMKIICKYMWSILQDLKPGAVEQGIFNYLIYNKIFPVENLIEIDCHSGAILTTMLFHTLNPVKVNNNMILRGDGGVPAIVHQYDRQASLIQLVNNLYREKIFQPYFPQDTRNALEQIPHIVLSGDFETALKFFVDYILGKTNFKGFLEMLIDTWGFILESTAPAKVYKEMTEIALQRAIIESANLTGTFLQLQIGRLLPHVVFAIKNNRTLSIEFKIFIARGTFYLAYGFFKNGNIAAAKSYLDIISALNIPLGQDFQNFRAQVYSRLGQNI